jgi:uncharacterized protein (DUF1697 family)
VKIRAAMESEDRMALVAFLRGANVGGHQVFQPAALAKQMARFGVVNIGAAGTFVATKPVTAPAFRAELARRLPFETEIMICPASEILALAKDDPFSDPPPGKDVRQLVTVLAKAPKTLPKFPVRSPEGKDWQVDLFRIVGRFAFTFWRAGRRRQIYPNAVAEKILGIPGTTRSWSAIEAACKILGE